MTPETSGAIQAIASIVSAIAATVALAQLWLLRKQLAADHDRSRREKAIELLKEWNNCLNRAHPSARNLVESFDLDECMKLRSRTPFYIPSEMRKTAENALQEILDKDPLTEEPGKGILLNSNHLFQIGFLCTTLLNPLEITLQAWANNIADKDILETELQYLVRPEQDVFILLNFRKVMGHVKTYPAIHAFANYISEKKVYVSPGKGPSG